jgi:hypothetical protein
MINKQFPDATYEDLIRIAIDPDTGRLHEFIKDFRRDPDPDDLFEITEKLRLCYYCCEIIIVDHITSMYCPGHKDKYWARNRREKKYG